MSAITESQGKVTDIGRAQKRKAAALAAASLALGRSDARGHRVAELLAMDKIATKHLLELNWQVRQDWFELCSELTDYPRCGTVPDDLRRMHWERIDAVGEAMEASLAGGDIKAALRRLAALC